MSDTITRSPSCSPARTSEPSCETRPTEIVTRAASSPSFNYKQRLSPSPIRNIDGRSNVSLLPSVISGSVFVNNSLSRRSQIRPLALLPNCQSKATTPLPLFGRKPVLAYKLPHLSPDARLKKSRARPVQFRNSPSSTYLESALAGPE